MNPSAHRREIDGLRAVAVAAVVIYHAVPGLLPGGFVGVDVFFVISGYLITGLLAAEWARSGRIDLVAFYARRARRLLPALLVLVLGVMGLLALLLGRHPSLLQDTGQSALASLLFLANFHFQDHLVGYFAPDAHAMPLLHLWSLAVEEQFYIVYPLLLMVLLRFVPGGVGRRIAVLALLSLLLAQFWLRYQPNLAFHQMPARFWELAAGALVALSVAPAAPRQWDRWLLPAGMLLVIAASVGTGWLGDFPGIAALPAVAGSALVLAGVHRGAAGGATAALLRSAPLVGLGWVSYSLYLWHWPLLVIDAQLRIDPPSAAWRLLLCLLALVLACLSWRFVEQPFRRGALRRPWRVLAAGAGATALAMVLVAGLARVDRVPAPARELADAIVRDVPAHLSQCHHDPDVAVGELMPSACRSMPDREPTLVIWGDSHAMAWQPFAWRLADATALPAGAITMNACPPAADAGDGAADLPAHCADMNRRAMAWLSGHRVDTLVLAMRWPLAGAAGGPVPPALGSRIVGLESAVSGLGHVRRILVIGPIPLLRRSAPDCVAMGWEQACGALRSDFDASAALAWRELLALQRRHPNVELVDPADYLCGPVRCLAIRDGHGLYWDRNHVTASAARGFAGRYLADPARYTRGPVPPAPNASPWTP